MEIRPMVVITCLLVDCYQTATWLKRDAFKPFGILMCNRLSRKSNNVFKFHEEDLSCRWKSKNVKKLPSRQSTEGPCITSEGIRQDYKPYSREQIRVYLNFYQSLKNWSESLHVCESERATLLIMNSRAKRTIFSEELVTMSRSANGDNAWVGLSRANLSAPWTWSDGRQVTETLRWSGHNIALFSTPEYNCAMAVTTFARARFFEYNCSRTNFFICECLVGN